MRTEGKKCRWACPVLMSRTSELVLSNSDDNCSSRCWKELPRGELIAERARPCSTSVFSALNLSLANSDCGSKLSSSRLECNYSGEIVRSRMKLSNSSEPMVRHKWNFTDFTTASHLSPICGAAGGLNIHWVPSFISELYKVEFSSWDCLKRVFSSLSAPMKSVPQFEYRWEGLPLSEVNRL